MRIYYTLLLIMASCSLNSISAMNRERNLYQPNPEDTKHHDHKKFSEREFNERLLAFTYAIAVLILTILVIYKQIREIYLESSTQSISGLSQYFDINSLILSGWNNFNLHLSYLKNPIYIIQNGFTPFVVYTELIGKVILLAQCWWYEGINLSKFLFFQISSLILLFACIYKQIPEFCIEAIYPLIIQAFIISRGAQISKIYQENTVGMLTMSRFALSFAQSFVDILFKHNTADIYSMSLQFVVLFLSGVLFSMFFLFDCEENENWSNRPQTVTQGIFNSKIYQKVFSGIYQICQLYWIIHIKEFK